MRFIIEAIDEAAQDRICSKFITMCALCSEDPRFCDGGGIEA
jgi:hypothetical protein